MSSLSPISKRDLRLNNLDDSVDLLEALSSWDVGELFEIFFQGCIISDTIKPSIKQLFGSLDQRIKKELLLKYLLRLVGVKLRDKNAWEIFLSLLASIREQEISEFLRQNVTSIAGITLTCKSKSTDIFFLVKKDIPLILELIVRVGHKWELLGTILGLPIEKINVWTITDNKIGLTTQ